MLHTYLNRDLDATALSLGAIGNNINTGDQVMRVASRGILDFRDGRKWVVIAALSMLLLMLVSSIILTVHADSTAYIWTDKADYAPESVVTIYGTGFLPNTTVTLTVTNPDATTATWSVLSNSTDGFATTYQLDSLGGTYYVNATDGTNNAETTFTDSIVSTATTLSAPPNPATLTSGSSYSWSGTVTPATGTIPAGDTVNLYYTTDGSCPTNGVGTGTELASTTTSSGGGFSSTFTAPAAGSYEFFARYNGHPGAFDKSDSGCASITVNPTTYSVTFDQSGIPTLGVTWGVTVNSVDHTGTGASITVSGLSGTMSYSYDSPVAGATGTRYVCSTGCSETVSGATTVSATYKTQYDLKFAQSGLDGTAQRTIVSVTIGANSPVNVAFTDFTKDFGYVDSGTTIAYTFTSTVASSTTGKQFVLTTPSPSPASGFSLSGPTTVTGTYKTQYYLTVSSAYDAPTGQGWYDAGSPANFGVTTPASGGAGIQYAFNGWTGSGTGSYTGSNNPGSVTMNAAITETAGWSTQYYVQYAQTGCVLSFSLPASEWVNSGGTATGSFQSTVSGSGTQCLFQSDNRPLTITSPTTITATYQTQYYLTVNSAHDSPTGQGWYNAGATASSSVTSPISGGAGTRYVMTGFSGTGDAPSSGAGPSVSFTINNPSSVTWNWKTQYYLTLSSSHDTPTGQGWYDSGSTASFSMTDTTLSGGAGVQYVFSGWSSGDVGGYTGPSASQSVIMNNLITETAGWATQYYITVTSAHDTPTASAWVNAGDTFTASVTSPAEVVANDHQWASTGFSVDGGGSQAGTTHSFINVQASHTIVFTWEEQFWIQVNSAHDSPTASQWVNQGDSLTVSVTSPADDNGHGTRYRTTGYTLDANTPVSDGSSSYSFTDVQSAHTITFNWMAQYLVTFDASSNVKNDGSGTVVTVGGAGKTGADLPFSTDWLDSGTMLSYSYHSPVSSTGSASDTRYRWDSTSGLSQTLQSNTFAVVGPGTITGTYVTQFKVTFDASANVKADSSATIVIVGGNSKGSGDLPFTTGWLDTGTSLSYAFQSPVASFASPSDTRYRWDSTTGLAQTLQANTFSVFGPGTITGAYVAQYKLTFDASTNVKSDGSGTIVIVGGSDKAGSDLQFTTDWLDSGTSLSYSYQSPVGSKSSSSDTQYRWDSTFGLGQTLQSNTFDVAGPGTITGNYVTQYKVSFDVSANVKSDGAGTIVTVGGSNKAAGNLPFTTDWIDTGTLLSFSYQSPVASSGSPSNTQYRWDSTSGLGQTLQSNTFAVSGPGTISVNYVTQYKIEFTATLNVLGDGSGTIVTVGGVDKSASDLPFTTDWIDSGTSLSYAYHSPVASTFSPSGIQYRWDTTSGLGQTLQAHTFTVTGPGTVTGAYVTQYDLQFGQAGLDGTAQGTIVSVTVGVNPAVDLAVAGLPHDFGFVDSGTTITYAFTSTVSSSNTGERFVLTTPAPSPASSFSLSEYTTVTGTYKTQYDLQFAQSGLDSSAEGTIVSVTIGANPAVNVIFTDFTKDFGYVDAGTTITYSFTTTVASSNTGEQFALTTPAPSPASPFTLNGHTTVTGTYETQWEVTFTNSGLGGDATGSLASLSPSGGQCSATSISVPSGSVYCDQGTSLGFAFTNPVTSSLSGKQYRFTSADTTSPYSVNGATKTITGSYVTQWQITFADTGLAGDATGTLVTGISASGGQCSSTSNIPVLGGSTYCDDGTAVSFTLTTPVTSSTSGKQYRLSSQSDASAYTVSGAVHTITGNYVPQWKVTFASSGLGGDATGTLVTGISAAAGQCTSTSNIPFSGGSIFCDDGTSLSFTFTSPVTSSISGKQYRLTTQSATSPYTVSGAPTTITGTYVAQWQITFANSGLGGDATGTLVTAITPAGACTSTANVNVPGGSIYCDAGTSLTYTFTSPVTSSVSGKQYRLTSTSPSSIATLSAATTVTGAYATQWQVTFAVNPIGAGTTSPSGTAFYDAGPLTITATHNAGYTFASWSSSTLSITFASSTSASTTATISGPGTITAGFTINTVITYIGATSGEYSDPVALQATLKDAFGHALVGYSLTFTIGSQSVTAITGAGGVASTSLVLNQPKGSYSVVVSFAGDSTYTASSSTTSFAINWEPATVVYTGTTSILTTSPTSITLSAQVTSEMDDAPGSISNALVTFKVYLVGASLTLVYTSAPTAVTQTSPGVGTVSLTISCSAILDTNCASENTYIVYAVLDPAVNNYYTAPDSYNTLVIYTPNGQFVTLGGWILDPNTGTHGNFGGVVRIKSNGAIQGSFVYVYRGACPTGVSSTNGLCDYMIKTTSWSGGSLSFSSFGCSPGVTCYAVFQAKGVIQVMDSVTGTVLLSQGNIQITVGAWDNTGTKNNGGVNQITISTVYPQPVGGVTSHQVGTVTSPISTKGGNIVVHPK